MKDISFWIDLKNLFFYLFAPESEEKREKAICVALKVSFCDISRFFGINIDC